MYEDDEDVTQAAAEPREEPTAPARPVSAGPSTFGLSAGALSGLFPELPDVEIPKSPVDPRQKHLAFAAAVLKGRTLGEGLQHGLSAYNDQSNKDAELYQRYLPLAIQAKERRAAQQLQQRQLQQKMLAGWNTSLLQNTSALLAQPGPVNPESVSQIVGGMARTGQVPPQVAQGFLSGLPSDPVALRAYLERAAIAASDPWRAVRVAKPVSVAKDAKLVVPSADGTTATTLVDNTKPEDPKDPMMRFLKELGIDPKSPEAQKWVAQYAEKLSTHQKPNQQTVIMKEENEESKTVGKFHGELYGKLQQSGLDAQSKLGQLARMKQMLVGYNTGKLTPTLKDLAAWGQSFGITLDSKLGEKEAVESLTNGLAMAARNPSGGAGMPGAMSDADRVFLQNTVPGLSKSKNGNVLIIETMRRLARRDIEVAQFAAKYRAAKGHIDTDFAIELQKWADANPLFADMAGGATAPSAPDPKRVDELVRGVGKK